MITKYIEFSIICDVCNTDGCLCSRRAWDIEENISQDNFDDMIPGSEKGIRDMRRIAKEYGWIYRNKKDICLKCQKRICGEGE